MTTEEMRKLHAQGYSYQAIGDMAGVSRQHVHARLNYYGTTEYNAKQKAKRERSKHRENPST